MPGSPLYPLAGAEPASPLSLERPLCHWAQRVLRADRKLRNKAKLRTFVHAQSPAAPACPFSSAITLCPVGGTLGSKVGSPEW